MLQVVATLTAMGIGEPGRERKISYAFSVIEWLVSVVILLSSKDGTLNARTQSSVLKCTERFVRVLHMLINTPRPCYKSITIQFQIACGRKGPWNRETFVDLPTAIPNLPEPTRNHANV
jgi:hypothetical protein